MNLKKEKIKIDAPIIKRSSSFDGSFRLILNLKEKAKIKKNKMIEINKKYFSLISKIKPII